MDNRYAMSLGRLAKKVEWEGGVLEAVQYGVTSDQIEDPELAAAWKEIESMWQALQPALARIDKSLSQARRANAA
jgi:hypothetical protein